MILNLPTAVAKRYKSPSQKARVMTEAWALQNMFCPACTSNNLKDMPPGTEAVDFLCPRCDSSFQLKAISTPIRRKIVDAAYDAMMRAINQNRLPHLLLLSYNKPRYLVNDLLLIPKHCLPPSSIERRKPLSPTARRAGWVGCNILLDLVPPDGRISIIRSGNVIQKASVRTSFKNVKALEVLPVKKRGWILDVLTAMRSLNVPEFSLDEAYAFERILSQRHPDNRHVRAKIRQQLQILRDLGYLQFVKRGHYRWLRG